MGNYSKFFAALIGGILTLGVARGLLPAEFNTPEIVGAATLIVSSIFVYMFPANKPPAE